MGKFLVLSRYHLKKNKGQYIAFCILVLIAAMIFGIGLVTQLNFGKNYEKKHEQYQCADVFFTMYESDWREELVEKASKIDGVTAVEDRDNICLSGNATYKDSGNSLQHIFFNMNQEHTMNQLKVVGDSLDIKAVKNPVYLSYWIKANGCEIGDTYKLVSGNSTYEFTIAGFVEDLMYGNNNCSNMGMYLPEQDFQKLYEEVSPETHAKTISLRLKNRSEGKRVYTKLSEYISEYAKNSYDSTFGYFEVCQRNRTITASIVSLVMVAFSVVLVIITMLVINFRIKSSVEEEMQNMGVMTSMGYTSRQVIWSVSMPYLVLGCVSVVFGLVASWLFMPVIESVLEKLAGLMWQQGVDVVATAIVVVVILGLIAVTTWLSTRKIKKLHPIEALRSGIKHHSFKKNHFPLLESRMNLQLSLGLKGFMANLKQYIFLFLILVVATFSMVYMSSGLYNSVVKPENFVDVISEENPTICLNATTTENANAIMDDMRKDERIKAVMFYDETSVIVGEDSIAAYILDESDKLQNDVCYKGRHPKHDNEIVMGCATADKNGLAIGDRVKVKYSSKEEEYLIVGLLQSPNQGGAACEMSAAGMKRLNKEFHEKNIYIYLENPKESEAVTKEYANRYKDKLTSYIDTQSMIYELYDNFIPLMSMVVGCISLVVVSVVIVVLYMIIKTVISHKKQELGISKALGYTTKQLIIQMVYSLLPSITLGTLFGGILGHFFVNKVWLLCLYGTGIRRVDLSVPTLWSVMIFVIMFVFSVLVSMLLSRRIKKVSTIKLIKE